MENTKERVLLRLSADARTELKVLAARRRTTASALVERWIRAAQDETKPA